MISLYYTLAWLGFGLLFCSACAMLFDGLGWPKDKKSWIAFFVFAVIWPALVIFVITDPDL